MSKFEEDAKGIMVVINWSAQNVTVDITSVAPDFPDTGVIEAATLRTEQARADPRSTQEIKQKGLIEKELSQSVTGSGWQHHLWGAVPPCQGGRSNGLSRAQRARGNGHIHRFHD